MLRTAVPRVRPSVGFMRDGSHPALTELLGHLGQHDLMLALEVDGELEGVVDLRQRAGRELDVDDGAGDGDDPAVLQLGLSHGHGGILLGAGPAARPPREAPATRRQSSEIKAKRRSSETR